MSEAVNAKDVGLALVAAYQAEMMEAEAAARKLERDASEAPSAMESHSDTSRNQMQILASNYRKRASELRELAGHMANRLCGLEESMETNRIAPWSMFTAAKNGVTGLFFVVPFEGGRSLTVGERRVTVLSAESTLGKQFLGRTTGSEFEFESGDSWSHFKIISVKGCSQKGAA